MGRTFFVTGTDTDIGKTFVSALLVKSWDCNYWKALQTGLDSDPGDTNTVKALTQLPESRFAPPQVELQTPLSPWRAALKDGVSTVQVSDINIPSVFQHDERPLIVEGAGGLFVPINEREITTDLIKHLNAEVILVARSGLGTVNHTLLSIEHLRSHHVNIAGIVFNGPLNADNVETVKHFAGDIPVIAQVPHSADMHLDSLTSSIPPISSV